jgi:hypothetical protein
MARRERLPNKGITSASSGSALDPCPPKNATQRTVLRSLKTGQFKRSEIKKAIKAVALERQADCKPA